MDKIIGKLAKEIPKSDANLKHYPVLVVGSHLGGVFTKYFAKKDEGKHPVFVAHDNSGH